MMKQNIVVIGGGGREHAICVALKKSPKLGSLYCVPGNAGIAGVAQVAMHISVMDFAAIYDFITSKPQIDLVIVAPDDPLYGGLVDYLTERGIKTFGPTKLAAEIEGSKAYSKRLMKKYNIPTAGYEEFDRLDEAVAYAQKSEYPLVVKADGLALGKGVIICQNFDEAKTALEEMMAGGKFGAAGNRVVIEEFMVGREVSVLAFTDGVTTYPMVSAQDHKRVGDGDTGLNTGGMGAFAPSPFYTDDIAKVVEKTIITPTVEALKAEGRPFKGVIYFGLMLTKDGVKVVEYNARFGDPEAQAVLPLLKTDLLDIANAIVDEKLGDIKVEFLADSAVVVMLCSGGYPGEIKKGLPITFGDLDKDVLVYHSGTAGDEKVGFTTNGGRVIGITAVAENIAKARDKVYGNTGRIVFDGVHFRRDIGNSL